MVINYDFPKKFSLILAFEMTMILRMIATKATIGFFPFFSKRSQNEESSLCFLRFAPIAAINNTGLRFLRRRGLRFVFGNGQAQEGPAK